jgi:hypothetical protein
LSVGEDGNVDAFEEVVDGLFDGGGKEGFVGVFRADDFVYGMEGRVNDVNEGFYLGVEEGFYLGFNKGIDLGVDKGVYQGVNLGIY